MKCNCQFSYDDCSFPDCYTKQELVDAIDAKNAEIRGITAKLEAATKALEIIKAASHIGDGTTAIAHKEKFYSCQAFASAALKSINERR